ncbi:hypothetical protein D3C79_781190 [compost metagenome]
MNGCPFQRGRSIPEFAFDRGACLAGEGNFFDRFCVRPFTKRVSSDTGESVAAKREWHYMLWLFIFLTQDVVLARSL